MACPEERGGVGGLGIQQRQEDLVLPQTTGGLHNKLITRDYKHSLLNNNYCFLIEFGEMQDKMSLHVGKQGAHTCRSTHCANWT